jgi:hypothetical protein
MSTLEPAFTQSDPFQAPLCQDLGLRSDRLNSIFLRFNLNFLPPDLAGKFDPIQRTEA